MSEDRGEDESRLKAHIEELIRQISPHGIEGALSEIEQSSRAIGLNIDRDLARPLVAQFGKTTMLGFLTRPTHTHTLSLSL